MAFGRHSYPERLMFYLILYTTKGSRALLKEPTANAWWTWDSWPSKQWSFTLTTKLPHPIVFYSVKTSYNFSTDSTLIVPRLQNKPISVWKATLFKLQDRQVVVNWSVAKNPGSWLLTGRKAEVLRTSIFNCTSCSQGPGDTNKSATTMTARSVRKQETLYCTWWHWTADHVTNKGTHSWWSVHSDRSTKH